MAKITTKKKLSTIILTLVFALMLPVICLLTAVITNTTHASGDNNVKFYTKLENINNGSFDEISSTYASKNVDGWSLIKTNTKATTMIIDVDKNFSNYNARPYCISTVVSGNPGKKGADNKILMINSANTDNNPSSSSYIPENIHEGYKSDAITLAKNSYYSFQASFKTLSFTNVSANPFASIYLSGLTDEEGNEIKLEYEMISAQDWTTVYFFVETGATEQKVNLELWLGTSEQSSFGVAFFDEVYVQRYSQNFFYETYYNNFYNENNFYYNVEKENTDSNAKVYNYYGENNAYNDELSRPLVTLCELDETITINDDINLDFEENISTSAPIDWTVADEKTQTANALVFDVNSVDSFKKIVGNDYSYTGSDLSYTNSKALALWTTKGETGYVALTSKDIEIKAHECLKFTAYVKLSSLTSGKFEFAVKENDTILKSFTYLDGNYTTLSTSANVSENGKDSFNNEYAEVSIYVQGHDMYDSSLNIMLSLGSKDTMAEGCVIVDNISVEKVNYNAYTNASNKLKLTTTSVDQSGLTIANGYFNSAYNAGKEFSYPLTATDWTVAQDTNTTGIYNGVVNTYEKYFNYFTSNNEYAKYYTNPGKTKSDSNNVFMFSNNRLSYQSITSKEFTLSKGTYYNFSLDHMNIKTSTVEDANIYVDIYTSDDVHIFTGTVCSLSNWDNYKAYLYAGDSELKVYAVISFGKETAKSLGIAYIDNVKLTESTKEEFDSAVHKSDLSNFMLNLDPTNSVGEDISNSLAFSTSCTINGAGKGGVAIGKGNQNLGYVKDGQPVYIDDGSLENNVLVINTNAPCTFTLTSKFDISLSATTYYKLSFRVLTSLIPEKDPNAKAEDNAYGVSVGLKDLDLASNLVFGEGWTDCTIYFYNANSETLNTKLVFSLTSLSHENTGHAYLTDLVWSETGDEETTLETAFTNASSDENYGKTIFTSTYKASTEEDKDEETTTPDNANDTNPLSVLIYVSTGITALAVIIAVVGIIVRKIKKGKKKVNKTGAEDYDKKISIENSVITNETNRIIKEESAAIEQSIEKYAADIKALEERQKENIALSRKQNGKITKEIEREFKSYAHKHGKIQDKLNMLNERLENVKSTEYRISVERKVESQMIRAKKEALKQAKENAKKNSK